MMVSFTKDMFTCGVCKKQRRGRKYSVFDEDKIPIKGIIQCKKCLLKQTGATTFIKWKKI